LEYFGSTAVRVPHLIVPGWDQGGRKAGTREGGGRDQDPGHLDLQRTDIAVITRCLDGLPDLWPKVD
jgi:hypothetical protein